MALQKFIVKSKLNPCGCGSTPKVSGSCSGLDGVCVGHGDSGPKISCECGAAVAGCLFAPMPPQSVWNRYHPS